MSGSSHRGVCEQSIKVMRACHGSCSCVLTYIDQGMEVVNFMFSHVRCSGLCVTIDRLALTSYVVKYGVNLNVYAAYI